MAAFDFTSFIIGVLLGMLVMLVLVWVAYFTRSFLFTYCATQALPCAGAEYYNDPGDALATNPQLEANDILFLNSDDLLLYKRVQKTSACTPQSNQTVVMTYPQYCSFSNTGTSGATWRETAFNSNIYKPYGFAGPTIVTDGNCIPSPGLPVSQGIPLVKWDANAVPR